MSGAASGPSASALFLLEAKSCAEEDRSPAACTVQYWLKPGAYSVGKPKHAEIAIDEDNSISRKHASLVVPPAAEREAGAAPFVLLTDHSKYGTATSQTAAFDDKQKLEKGQEARVAAGRVLLFGYNSPYKLYHQDWALYLSPQQRQRAAPGEVEALEAAAAATGLPLTDELPDCPGTRVLALGAAPLHIDGPVLLALLRGFPVVGANWLLEWQQQKVWCNRRPAEAAYPVQLQYGDGSGAGRLKALPPQPGGAEALAAARAAAPLAGRTLLWLPPARDAALQEAAQELGAANHDVAASGRAPAAAKAAGAVLVRGGPDDAVPAAYRRMPWTTPELLIACMLENRVAEAIHPPAEAGPDATPPSAGRKGRAKAAAPGSRSGKKGRGRGRAGAAAAGEEEGEEAPQASGSETDASEDERQLARGGTQRVLAAGKKAAGAAAAPPTQQQQQQEEDGSDPEALPAPAGRRGKAAAAAAAPAKPADEAAPSAAQPAGGRKRRQSEAGAEQQQQYQAEAEQQEAAARPTPAKKQRRQEQPPAATPAPAAAAAAAAAQPAAPAPAAEGWHARGAGHPQPQRSEHTPGGAAAGQGPEASSVAKPATGRRRGSAAAAAPAAAEEEAEEGHEEEEEEGEEYEEEQGNIRVTYTRMVLPPPSGPPATPGGGGGGANFKAFRKAGGGAAAAAAAPAAAHPLVTFDPQPYAEQGAPNADAFLKAEAERRRRAQQADELFAANIKAKKAAQLPDPDDDSPPAKGCGRGKKAAAPAAGQKSILGFLPPAGAGRGRGRGAGRGRK